MNIEKNTKNSKRDDFLELIKSGYAGVMPGTGMIVDCRENPLAVPVQKNSLLNVPESKAEINIK